MFLNFGTLHGGCPSSQFVCHIIVTLAFFSHLSYTPPILQQIKAYLSHHFQSTTIHQSLKESIETIERERETDRERERDNRPRVTISACCYFHGTTLSTNHFVYKSSCHMDVFIHPNTMIFWIICNLSKITLFRYHLIYIMMKSKLHESSLV